MATAMPVVNQLLLVTHIDIFIAALIGFLFLLRFPRGLARLWRKSEWLNVWLSRRHAGSGNAHIVTLRNPSSARPIKEPPGNISAELASAASLESYEFNGSSEGQVNERGTLRPSYPPHIPAHPAFFRPFMGPLRRSIVPGYSNLQILVMLAYLGILLYGFSYRSNFLNNPVRSGLLAASQLPFLYAFAAKNSVPGSLLGVGYQSHNFFHRHIGRLVVLAANVHGIGMLYRLTFRKTISAAFQEPSARFGLLSLTCMDVLFVFSMSVWREKAYNIFRYTHLAGYLILVPALYLHKRASLPFIIAASSIYLIDRVLCLVKTRHVTAAISPLPILEATRIEIPSLNCGWRAGQHVRLRVLSTSVGWLGWMEPHPFTIASAPTYSKEGGVGNEGLVLICKKAGGWTSRLFDMAKASESNESGANGAGSSNRSVKVLIEGPYGGPGHTIFASFSAVALVVGGSGVTFALSTIQDLVQKGLHGESSVKVIELVWIVQHPDAIKPFLPVFTSLLNSCPYLTIYLHYTRPYIPYTGEKTNPSTLAGDGGQSQVVPPGLAITVHPGRPGRQYLASVMENVITRAASDANGARGALQPNGLLVGVCGPPGMDQFVNAVVGDINPELETRIGGIEMHLETFGF